MAYQISSWAFTFIVETEVVKVLRSPDIQSLTVFTGLSKSMYDAIYIYIYIYVCVCVCVCVWICKFACMLEAVALIVLVIWKGKNMELKLRQTAQYSF